MNSPHMPYDPIAWGQRIAAATHWNDFTALLVEAEQGYGVARGDDWCHRTPETESRRNHWSALLRAITLQRDLRFPSPPVTYSITDYETPGELRHRVGHLS